MIWPKVQVVNHGNYGLEDQALAESINEANAEVLNNPIASGVQPHQHDFPACVVALVQNRSEMGSKRGHVGKS